jgi:dynein heavy chain
MQKSLELIPDHLLENFTELTKELFSEIFESYADAMRLTIMHYILLNPEERKRLHILMLPRTVLTSSDRSLQKGGFSTVRYSGQHQRVQDS